MKVSALILVVVIGYVSGSQQEVRGPEVTLDLFSSSENSEASRQGSTYVNAISDDEVLLKWQLYQEQFGKTYKSPIESHKRLAIFKDNLQKIENHNTLYEHGKTTYTKGINQFTDWTKEEFLNYVNKGLITKPSIHGKLFTKTGNTLNITSIDWRLAGVVTDVKDQGSCGSCWSFSATGSIEGQLGRKLNLISLSEQCLIDCSAVYGNNGCGGGFMTSAFKFVKDNGILSEQEYPYKGVDEYCQADPSKIVTRLTGYFSIDSGDEEALREAIASIGPVSVAIDATENLQSYSGGILNDYSCSSRLLNHGVLAVGYGSENGQDYYIVKNSWGASWGEAGYFRLGRNQYNPCGIASMASFPEL